MEAIQRRWSRGQETDFVKTVINFGVDFSLKEGTFVWERFRQLSKLDKKFDDTLTDYYNAFVTMCQKVVAKEPVKPPVEGGINVEPISEEKALKAIERLEMFKSLRESILIHDNLEERLRLCKMTRDMPEWWICGKHDKDLLIGGAKHGVSRMELHVLNDPDLCFKDIMARHLNGEDLLDEKELAHWEPQEEEEPKDDSDTDKKDADDSAKVNGEVVIEKSPGKSKKSPCKSPGKDDKENVEETEDDKDESRGNGDASSVKEDKKENDIKKMDESDKMDVDENGKHNNDGNKSDKDQKEARSEDDPEDKKVVENGDNKSVKDEEEPMNGKREDSVKDESNDKEASEDDKKDKSNVSVTITPAVVKPAEKRKQRQPPPAITSFSAPNFTLQQIEQMAKGGIGGGAANYDIEAMSIDLMAQTYAAAIRWPKDRVLAARLEQVMACVDTGELF